MSDSAINTQHHFPYVGKNKRRFQTCQRLFDEPWQNIRWPQYLSINIQQRLHSDAKDAFRVFAFAHVDGQENSLAFRYFSLAHQLFQLHVQLELNPGVEQSRIIEGHTIVQIGKPYKVCMHGTDLIEPYCSALLIRDFAAIEGMQGYQHDNFIHPLAEALDYEAPLADFFLGIFNPSADINKSINEFIRLSAPECMPQRRQPYTYNVLMPFLEILLSILAKDEARYHQAIKYALTASTEHYSQKRTEGVAFGWVPLHICGPAALAFDQLGYKLPEPSPYLPEWLIYGDFKEWQ
ncbi:immunity 49 family protein [Catenovulum sp. SM1970]|uniref:Imm49 family immunity protein n=1 Tax=Marinifaba aquimaris TaxID=2741323 RepID=UPI001573C20D|nr:Imm49 family immunity protein [Marinifaba aquimaris]NTS78120.1 immunity 49 family protein [Marinifaba aquimaris]